MVEGQVSGRRLAALRVHGAHDGAAVAGVRDDELVADHEHGDDSSTSVGGRAAVHRPEILVYGIETLHEGLAGVCEELWVLLQLPGEVLHAELGDFLPTPAVTVHDAEEGHVIPVRKGVLDAASVLVDLRVHRHPALEVELRFHSVTAANTYNRGQADGQTGKRMWEVRECRSKEVCRGLNPIKPS